MDLPTSLSLILPEEILSAAGLILLVVAGWAGNKAGSAISIAACVVLGACFFITALIPFSTARLSTSQT